MSWIDKLTQGFSKKAEHEQTSALDVMKTKLKGIVYDDELVDELAPIFAKLSTNEGFDKVVELLETKEAQLEMVAGGQWTKQTTNNDESSNSSDKDEEENNETLSADEILARKYKSE